MPDTLGTFAVSPLLPTAAAFSLRSPPPFLFDEASRWPAWLQQFEDHSLASGLSAASEETKVRTLLYCRGRQARVVLSSIMLDDEAYRSYADVSAKLTG